MFNAYDDTVKMNPQHIKLKEEEYSPYQDLRFYFSSVTPDVRLAMNVLKPQQPSYLLIECHGWHMSMPQPKRQNRPHPHNDFLRVQVDMRGRTYSGGEADCNGYELIDIYDAIHFARIHYKDYLLDPDVVYVEGKSGGAGNVFALVAKFPDTFTAATALYGVTDYTDWYRNDTQGEFRDELDQWIGCSPNDDGERYRARNGLFLAPNLHTPVFMAHGDGDLRIPVKHSKRYVQYMRQLRKSHLIQYVELKGVGGIGHLDLITDEQIEELTEQIKQHRQQHRTPITLPEKGQFLVGGYLYTKAFQVHLDSHHHIAMLHYDLSSQHFELIATQEYPYTIITADGQHYTGTCCIQDEDAEL